MKYFLLWAFLILLTIQKNELNAQNNSLAYKKIVNSTYYPIKIEKYNNRYFISFNKAYFGKLKLNLNPTKNETIYVVVGEKSTNNNRVDTHPPGTIRYLSDTIVIEKGKHLYELNIPDFKPPSWAGNDYFIPLPGEVGNVIPFRYVEINGYTGKLEPKDVQQIAYYYPFNDSASYCETSSTEINQIWDLCKHTIKATSFCGIYIDGDRERRPYEADAYINQLGHYVVDTEFGLARKSIDHLVKFPTWPSEWLYHMPMMLWEDYMYTGNTDYLKKYFAHFSKLITEIPKDSNGLVTNFANNDIIDWPKSERDGYQVGNVNTVPNAFYYNSLIIQSKIAGVLGYSEDSVNFANKAVHFKNIFNELFWNKNTGLYIDALDSLHSSIHANIFPVVFGLADQSKIDRIWPFIGNKGMAVSVYGAQYLLDMLYMIHQPDYAFKLLTAHDKRSWMHMIEQGGTITWEAWNEEVKDNLDWNHAWGAAPVNIIARRIFGIRPLTAGFKTALIEPQFNGLSNGYIKHPTINGDITVSFESNGKDMLKMQINNNMPAQLLLPFGDHQNTSTVVLNSKKIKPTIIHKQMRINLNPGENIIQLIKVE